MAKVTLTLDCGILGHVECEVEYSYSPAERGSSCEPAIDEEFEILEVTALVGDEEITLNSFPIDEDALIEEIKDYHNEY